LLVCARRGDFDSGHFTRVDMVALYWHLVDLIWIYLFLLLYLID
jgi:cytochrome c oxidase subunit 3